MPRSKKSSKSGTASRALSKSEFIREQPTSMSAKEVVALGAKKGLKFAEGYVYAIRAANRAHQQPKPTKTKPLIDLSTSNAILEALVLDLGLTKVQSMLVGIERRIVTQLRGASRSLVSKSANK